MYKILLLTLLFPLAIFAKSGRPNIIFFIVDDYDKLDCSLYTGPKGLTPSMERLAKNGITFDRMHMTSTVCTPSRYTCMTGRYPGNSYSPQYLEECPKGTQGLPAFNLGLENDNMNVAQVLSDNGYVTGLVGKYHVGSTHGLGPEKNTPYSDKVNEQKYKAEKHGRELIKKRGFDWAKNVYMGNLKSPFNVHNPEWTSAAALEFVTENKDKPFFLYYGTTLSHGTPKGWDKSLDEPLVTGEGRIKKPIGNMSRDTVRSRVAKLGLEPAEKGGILWMDDSLGALLDHLDKLGIADNTLICFVADHGSKGKASLHGIGTEVPCIISWPAGMKKNVRCEELVQSTDFVATWFDIAGAKLPEKYLLDGISFKSLFQNPTQKHRDYVYCENGPARAIKTKDWNYVALRYTKEHLEAMESSKNYAKRLLGLSGGIGRSFMKPEALEYDQLYNLSSDSDEMKNLALNPEYAPKVKEMQVVLSKKLKTFPERPYGEFIPGPNTLGKGDFDIILDSLKNLRPSDGSKPTKKKKGKKKDKENKDDNKKKDKKKKNK